MHSTLNEIWTKFVQLNDSVWTSFYKCSNFDFINLLFTSCINASKESMFVKTKTFLHLDIYI